MARRADGAALEADYRERLGADFGIVFNRLLTLTNMPIARFARSLIRTGGYGTYLRMLSEHFNAATIDGLMCRTTLSVGWDGLLYDCDFNQMLEMPIAGPSGSPLVIHRAKPADLEALAIRTADHCYGCTAGAGSGCGGAITSKSEPARSAVRSESKSEPARSAERSDV